jgi:hypothetical protein
MDKIVPECRPLVLRHLRPEVQLLRMRTWAGLDMGRYTFRSRR